MFGIRILSVLTAYTVVLLEVYSGAVKGPTWWIYPGALVIALLLSLSTFAFSPAAGEGVQKPSMGVSAIQWVLIIAASFAMAWFANHMGRNMLPEMIAGGV